MMSIENLLKIVFIIAGAASLVMMGCIVWLLSDGETTAALSMLAVLFLGYLALWSVWSKRSTKR